MLSMQDTVNKHDRAQSVTTH